MTDLISREALIKELETFDEEFEPQIDEVYALITNAPAITPQQPQEQVELVKKAVADALEEAAKICDVNLMSWADDDWNGASKDCAKRIRAIIKRDAEGVE